MKKLFLLFLGAVCGSAMYAQNTVKNSQRIGFSPAKKVATDATPASSVSNPVAHIGKTRNASQFASTLGTKWIVGHTTYDLQTNGAPQRRVLQSGNTVSCGWTFSLEQNVTSTSTFTDRGTGYNYYDGSTWGNEPSLRLENIRTGFGCFAGPGGANEYYIAHDGANNKFIMNKKTGTTWAQSTLATSSTQTALWPHTAMSGNWLYIVSSSTDSNIHSNGVRFGIFFSRSNDGGTTWLDDQIPMPLLDSVKHYRGGGNTYSISANGSHVAVLIGDVGTNMTLISSNDNGANWTKTEIMNWPIDNYNFGGTDMTDTNGDLVPDTLWTCDGAHSLTLDATGKAHVAFTAVRVYKPGGSTGYNFFFQTWLLYWNSGMTTGQFDSLDSFNTIWHDCDENGAFGLGDNYTSGLTPAKDAIYNTIGTISQPCITLTSTGKVLVAYSAIMDNDTTTDDPGPNYWAGPSDLPGQNFRDIMLIGNSGTGWTIPVNISRTAHFEEAFPSMAENISGNNLAVLYQADAEPGTILSNADVFDPYFMNVMVCHFVNIDSFFNNYTADTSAPCHQFELPLAVSNVNLNGNVKVYPNPAFDVINVNANLNEVTANLTYQISDMTGRVVYTESAKNVKSYNRVIAISQLTSGTYILNVITDHGKYTEKIIKK